MEFTKDNYELMLSVAHKQALNPFGSQAVYRKYLQIVKLLHSQRYVIARLSVVYQWNKAQAPAPSKSKGAARPEISGNPSFYFNQELYQRKNIDPYKEHKTAERKLPSFLERFLVRDYMLVRRDLVLLDNRAGFDKSPELDKLTDEMHWLLLFEQSPMSKKEQVEYTTMPLEWAASLLKKDKASAD
jgi:hypothetical protein